MTIARFARASVVALALPAVVFVAVVSSFADVVRLLHEVSGQVRECVDSFALRVVGRSSPVHAPSWLVLHYPHLISLVEALTVASSTTRCLYTRRFHFEASETISLWLLLMWDDCQA